MKIEHLEEIVALADAGNFAEAAKRCHVSQSSLSKHISGIEAEVKADLIWRPSVPLRFTECGKSFVEDARVIVNEYRSALDRVAAIRSRQSQTINVGYCFSAAQWIVKRAFVKSHRDNAPYFINPIVHSPASVKESLLRKRIDVSICLKMDNDLDASCNSMWLADEHLLLAVSKSHPLASYDEVKLVDLEDELFLRPIPHTWPAITEHLEQLVGGLPGYRNGLFLDDPQTVILGVMDNMGVAVLLDHNRSIYGDRVRFLRIKEEVETGYTIPLVMTWLKETELQRAKADMIEYMKKLLVSLRR